MKCDPKFLFLLKDLHLRQMEESSDVIYIIDKKFVLRAFNPAWESFAKENNGQDVLKKCGLGTSVVNILPSPIKGYYMDLYRKTLSSGARVDCEYECSSAKLFRQFIQSLYPLPDQAGILISNHFKVERLHDHQAVESSPDHRDKNGILVQCCHCRRTKNQITKNQWDWIPDFVEAIPAQTSHGLCHRCTDFYYPGLSATLSAAA